MDPSALIAAATTLLALFFSASQVSAQHGLCPPEPVVVHLSRGQKVTVRYWVGEEVQQEVTEVPKLTRRPPRPTTTTPTTPTTSYDELHGRLGEHNTTATLPDEEEASTATSITVEQTTPEVANLTISEYAHRDEGNVTEQEESITAATQSESTVKSIVSEENDQHSTSPENEATTTQITAEEVTTSSTAGSSATSDVRDDSETTVTTIEPTSSISHLKHEVEYAADAEPVETGHTESQTTTSPVAEETTYTETTTTPTTQQSEVNTGEDHVTEGLLYRSPNNDSQSITLSLDDSVNLENLTEASILQTNETSGTEEQQSTTVSSISDSTSTDDVSTTTTDSDRTPVPSSDADIAAKVATAFADTTTPEAVEQTETTQTEVQEGNTSERTTEEGTSSPTTESTVSEGTTIYPTTLSYREGPDDDSLVIVDDENNQTNSEKSSIAVISSNNNTNEFSLEQSFSVDTLNESDISNASGNVSVYVQDSNDTVSEVSAQASITTEFPHTTQTLADELSETPTTAETSTDASLRTSSESVETTSSAAEISVTDGAESAPNVTNYEAIVEQDTVQETAPVNNVSESSVEDNTTIHADEATTTSGSDDDLDEFALDSTMPPLVAADKSLVESILHQVLVANSTEGDEEAKEGRQLDKDNDVYPGVAEPEQNDEDDGQEEVHVATEEYLSTLVQETPAENNEESPSSTQQPAAKDDEESVDPASDENIPAGPRRGPDPNPDWDSPVSHYAYPESNGAHGPRVYIASRSRRDVSPAKANTTLCQWVFKTDPGIPLLLTFKNFSTPDSERCVLHHIAVERSNGYEARWCGEAYESPSHATFARHEIKLRLYSEHDGGAPSGFIAEIQALDMKLLRKAVPKARPLLHHPHHPHH